MAKTISDVFRRIQRLMGRAGRRPAPPRQRARRASRALLIALEPRYLFDGAVVVTAADAAHQASPHTDQPGAPDPLAQALTNHVLPADPTAGVSAPTQVRAADPVQNGGKKEVAFVDSSVADYQALVDGVRAGVEVEVINGGQSGLAQMAKWAETHTGYDAIHVLSHGAEAQLHLGTDTVTDAGLATTATQVELAEIGHAMNTGGDLLLYGCDVGAGSDGQRFVADLAAATGADVAASVDESGAAALGGNWALERSVGTIETPALAPQNYNDLLSFTGTTVDIYLLNSDNTLGTEFGAKTVGSGDEYNFMPAQDTQFDFDPTTNRLHIHLGPGVELLDIQANFTGGNIDHFTGFSVDTVSSNSAFTNVLTPTYSGKSLKLHVTDSTVSEHVGGGDLYFNISSVDIGPAAPTTTVTTAGLSADTGTSGDFITNTAAQTVSGGLSAALVSGEKVEVSYDGGTTWSDTTTASLVGDRTWTTTTTLSGGSTFEARVTNAGGSSTAWTHTYALDTTDPSNSAAPTISGTSTVTNPLTTTTGTFSDANAITYSYQWQNATSSGGAGAADIGGATSVSYTLRTTDAHKYVRSAVSSPPTPPAMPPPPIRPGNWFWTPPRPMPAAAPFRPSPAPVP